MGGCGPPIGRPTWAGHSFYFTPLYLSRTTHRCSVPSWRVSRPPCQGRWPFPPTQGVGEVMHMRLHLTTGRSPSAVEFVGPRLDLRHLRHVRERRLDADDVATRRGTGSTTDLRRCLRRS